MSGHIDWDHPPSTRVRARATGPRLLADSVVLAMCAAILWVLAGVLLGDHGVSASGVRRYLVDGPGGSLLVVWGVALAVALAALYAVIDAVRALLDESRAHARSKTHDSDR